LLIWRNAVQHIEVGSIRALPLAITVLVLLAERAMQGRVKLWHLDSHRYRQVGNQRTRRSSQESVRSEGAQHQSNQEDHPLMTTESTATTDMSAELTDGYHLVVHALKLNDVRTIYGVVGIPITDVARVAQASGIRYIGFRHESDAGHAAAAAGFLTKKPGICLTVSAPGFLNGLVALANATTNCFPMVQISGSSERHIVDLKRGDYEELDQVAAAQPFAKAAYRVNRAEDIGRGIARAIRTAVSGRPGGVYLDLPAKLFGQVMDAEAGQKSLVKVIDAAPAQIPSPDSIKRALDVLKSAKRPLIILGKGAAYAQADDAIRQLVEKSGAPFLPMSMGKGLLPDTHP